MNLATKVTRVFRLSGPPAQGKKLQTGSAISQWVRYMLVVVVSRFCAGGPLPAAASCGTHPRHHAPTLLLSPLQGDCTICSFLHTFWH